MYNYAIINYLGKKFGYLDYEPDGTTSGSIRFVNRILYV